MLYYQNAPHANDGLENNTSYFSNNPNSGTSLEFYQKSNGASDATNDNMVSYSPDMYSVAGQGVSGAIRPYRTTNGSVAVRDDQSGDAKGHARCYNPFPKTN